MGNYSITLVLILSLAVTMFGSRIMQNKYQTDIEIVGSYKQNQAKKISEAIMMAVSNQINDGVNVSNVDSFTEWNDMGGSYKYTIVSNLDTVTINGWGKVEQFEYKQQMKMIAISSNSTWKPNLPFAVFSGNNISLSGSAKVSGHVGTNATGNNDVNLSWATKIDSSVLIGPGGDPSTTVRQASGKNVGLGVGNLPSAATYELPDFIEYPPKNVIKAPVVTLWPATNITLNPSDYDGAYIPFILVQSNYTLNINTGTEDRVMYVGDFNLSQGQVNVIGTGKLTLIVEDDFRVSGSSKMNGNGDQEKLLTYYGGADELNFAGATMFNGSVYAEKADIKIAGSSGIQGHIITGGNNVNISGAAGANVRMIYAPKAVLSLSGSASVSGAIVAKEFTASGAARVQFSSTFTGEIPEIEMNSDNSTGSGYAILSWH